MKIVYWNRTNVGRSDIVDITDGEKYFVYDTVEYTLKPITAEEIRSCYYRDSSDFYNVICTNKVQNTIKIKVMKDYEYFGYTDFKQGSVEWVVLSGKDGYTLIRVRGGACFIVDSLHVPVILNESWLYFSTLHYKYSCQQPMLLEYIGTFSSKDFNNFISSWKRKLLLGKKTHDIITTVRKSVKSNAVKTEDKYIAIHLKSGEILRYTKQYNYRLNYDSESFIDATLLLGKNSLYKDACGYYTSRATSIFKGWDSKTWNFCIDKRDKVIETLGGIKRFNLFKVKHSVGCAEIKQLSYGQVLISSTDYGMFCKIGSLGYALLQVGRSLFVCEATDYFTRVPFVMRDSFIAVADEKCDDAVLLKRCDSSLNELLNKLESGDTVDYLKQFIESHLTGINQYVVCKDMEE